MKRNSLTFKPEPVDVELVGYTNPKYYEPYKITFFSCKNDIVLDNYMSKADSWSDKLISVQSFDITMEELIASRKTGELAERLSKTVLYKHQSCNFLLASMMGRLRRPVIAGSLALAESIISDYTTYIEKAIFSNVQMATYINQLMTTTTGYSLISPSAENILLSMSDATLQYAKRVMSISHGDPKNDEDYIFALVLSVDKQGPIWFLSLYDIKSLKDLKKRAELVKNIVGFTVVPGVSNSNIFLGNLESYHKRTELLFNKKIRSMIVGDLTDESVKEALGKLRNDPFLVDSEDGALMPMQIFCFFDSKYDDYISQPYIKEAGHIVPRFRGREVDKMQDQSTDELDIRRLWWNREMIVRSLRFDDVNCHISLLNGTYIKETGTDYNSNNCLIRGTDYRDIESGEQKTFPGIQKLSDNDVKDPILVISNTGPRKPGIISHGFANAQTKDSLSYHLTNTLHSGDYICIHMRSTTKRKIHEECKVPVAIDISEFGSYPEERLIFLVNKMTSSEKLLFHDVMRNASLGLVKDKSLGTDHFPSLDVHSLRALTRHVVLRAKSYRGSYLTDNRTPFHI